MNDADALVTDGIREVLRQIQLINDADNSESDGVYDSVNEGEFGDEDLESRAGSVIDVSQGRLYKINA